MYCYPLLCPALALLLYSAVLYCILNPSPISTHKHLSFRPPSCNQIPSAHSLLLGKSGNQSIHPANQTKPPLFPSWAVKTIQPFFLHRIMPCHAIKPYQAKADPVNKGIIKKETKQKMCIHTIYKPGFKQAIRNGMES